MTSKSDPSSKRPERLLDQIYRDDWGRLVSLLVARTRRLDLVEDAVAEAFARAAQRWPIDGVPGNPAGWLYTAAHRQVIGRLRAEAIAGRKAPLLASRSEWAPPELSAGDLPDDRLHLVLFGFERRFLRFGTLALRGQHGAFPIQSGRFLVLLLHFGL